MKKGLFSPPDPFGMLPLLSLLPNRGSATQLHSLKGALFARFEKVAAQKKAVADQGSREQLRRFSAEEAMLKQVLDWMSDSGEQRS